MSRPSHQPPTVAMIAQRVGVATCTASAVLNGQSEQRRIHSETARRVLEEAKRLHYVPNDLARGLRARRTGVVGVILADFTNNWADRVMAGLNPVFDQHDYLAFILTHRWDSQREQRELRSLVQRRVDGIIVVPLPGSVQVYGEMTDRGMPLLFLGDTLEETPWASHVTWDSSEAVKVLVRHLLSADRRRVALLRQDWASLMSGRVRRQAFEQTLRQADVPFNPDWEMCVHDDSEVAEEVRRVFGRPPAQRPDALYANNDGLAFAALAALRQLNLRVPQDVAVVGMGDLPRGDDLGAGLTTVREPCEELGRLAAETILNAVSRTPDAAGPAPAARILVPGSDLRVRRTTGFPEATATMTADGATQENGR